MKTQSTNRSFTGRYALIQGSYWINFASVLAFSSVYLLDRGLTSGQIGLIMAISGLAAAAAQPIAAGYADRPSSPSLKVLVTVTCLLATLMGAAVCAAYRHSPLLTGLLFGGCVAVLQFLLPFINSLGTEMLNQGYSLNWGLSRGIGSIVYAAASSFLGMMVLRAGVISIPICIALGYGVLTLCVWRYPFQKKALTSAEGQKPEPSSPGVFFKRYPRFFIVLAGAAMLYVSHVFINTFLYQIIQANGGGSGDVGLITSMCGLIEIPPMLFFARMLKKAGCGTWFKICGAAIALKSIGTLLVSSMEALYAVQLFQLLGWGLISIVPVYYVNQVIRAEDAIKGQAYMAMTYTIGSVAASLAGGALIDLAGVNVMLFAAAGTGLAGAVVIGIFAER